MPKKESESAKAPKKAAPKKKLSISTPDVKDLLKAGVQFGHEVKRWNPLMAQYIFGAKNSIHIVDITQTAELLKAAAEYLYDVASKGGEVLFIGTKRQAVDIVKEQAISSNSYYVVGRWVGGFFTNFKQVRRSMQRLQSLEESFESGVEGRTKYEVSRMKSEWQRLNRLYEGVKTMEKFPAVAVVVDPHYERAAVKECRAAGIPVVALTDTNCNPRRVNHIIPGNDDAIGSIDLIISTLAEAIRAGNGGKGVKHTLKDYSEVDVKIVKPASTEVETQEEVMRVTAQADEVKTEAKSETKAKRVKAKVRVPKTKKVTSEDSMQGGILGKSRGK